MEIWLVPVFYQGRNVMLTINKFVCLAALWNWAQIQLFHPALIWRILFVCILCVFSTLGSVKIIIPEDKLVIITPFCESPFYYLTIFYIILISDAYSYNVNPNTVSANYYGIFSHRAGRKILTCRQRGNGLRCHWSRPWCPSKVDVPFAKWNGSSPDENSIVFRWKITVSSWDFFFFF